MKKTIYLSSVILTSFLFISNAFADDCVQKRKTPQAPNNILKQTNPLEITPENISAGEMLYKKGAKPLACSQCHGRRGKRPCQQGHRDGPGTEPAHCGNPQGTCHGKNACSVTRPTRQTCRTAR